MRKLIALVMAVLITFAVAACGNDSKSKTMTIRLGDEYESNVIQPGAIVQLEVFEADVKLSGATFSLVSGPAAVDSATGILTCNADAQDEAVIKVGAALSGYTCDDFTLTVDAPARQAAPAVAYAGDQDREVDTVAPGTKLPFGVYADNQKLAGATFSIISGPATIDPVTGWLTCDKAAQKGDVIVVGASSANYAEINSFALTVAPVWNQSPTVTDTFFDDFSMGIRPSVWDACNQSWGAGNNGVRPDNTFYSRDTEKAAAEGVESGGIAVLRSQGDLTPEENRNRSGGAIITQQAFGPGLFEVRSKVVPRIGQCSAMWTYWTAHSGATIETNKYSEIDIEMPIAANYAKWAGTTYKYFDDWDTLVERGTYEQKKPSGVNDGEWHVWAFEWRTDDSSGDNKVVWYLDGEKMFEIANYTPEYTATFWIGNWFPEDRGWVGIADFDYAYMYVDWVRITSYDDPVKTGATNSGPSTNLATDLADADIPQNQYIVNGQFERLRGSDFIAWEKSAGSVMAQSGAAVFNESSTLRQTVNAQYAGYAFDLNVNARVLTGSGKLTVYVQYMSGVVSLGKSEELSFDASESAQDQTLRFTIPDLRRGSNTVTAVRVVIETEAGTTAEVNRVEMFMQK